MDNLSELPGYAKTSLADVVAGDFVVLDRDSWSGEKVVPAQVFRVTKTQVVINNEKFNKRTGRKVGSANDWMAVYIYAMSQADPWNSGRICAKKIRS